MITDTNQLLGYKVEKQEQFDFDYDCTPAYLLKGPKGAVYALYRNYERPEILVAMNHRHQCEVQVKGYSWFTDKDGQLRPLS